MTKTLTLLLTSAALCVGLSLPSWSAMQSVGASSPAQAVLAAFGQAADGAKLILVDDDDDEDEGEGYAMTGNSDHEDEDDDNGCEEDEGSCGSVNDPAPAASAAPPQNGLFSNGTAPKAQVN